MKCIIIEDQAPAQRILTRFIADMGTLELRGTFSDALQALAFLKEEKVDLIFLDLHLPKVSGREFLQALPNPPAVILTTAFSDYALESYEWNVVDYLLKPFSFQRFVKAVQKVAPLPLKNMGYEEGSPASKKEIFIKSGHEYLRVEPGEVLYIQADGDYTELITPRRKFLSAHPLRYWLETLDTSEFIRVHKSYIINRAHIEKVAGNQIYLRPEGTIPIGRAYKEAFVKQFLH